MISNGRHRSISNSLSGQALNGDLAYGLNATQGTQSNNGTYSGNVNYLSPFTTLSGSYSHLSENQQAFYYSASGSLVADSSGLTLSPQKIGDTFGVLTIPGLAGISVSTPGGKVKTYGKQGKAVIPRLREYQPSLINVDTSTLPPAPISITACARSIWHVAALNVSISVPLIHCGPLSRLAMQTAQNPLSAA